MAVVDFAAKYGTARGRVLALLQDQQWHAWRELRDTGGVRYGARLLELKRQGWRIIDRAHDEDGRAYHLESLELGEPQTKRVRVYMAETDAEAAAVGFITTGARSAVRDGLASFRARKETL